MELKIEEIKALEPVKFNYEELKKELQEKVEKYKNLVYTEENIGKAKEDRAKLNKLKKALNDENKRVKGIYMKPYDEDFKPKIKELTGMVDEAVENVDSQVKNFEQKAKDEKMAEIEKHFNENIGDLKELIELDEIFNDRWLNKTYAMKDIEKDINHIISKTKTDLGVIDKQFADENINNQLKYFYLKNINSENVLTLTMVEAERIKKNMENLKELAKEKQIQENIKTTPEVNQSTAKKDIRNGTVQLNFKVWVNAEQAQKLKAFLSENEIKFERLVLENGNSQQ